MNNSEMPLSYRDSIHELPAQAHTRSGVEFDPRSERWVYRDVSITVSLNFATWYATDSFLLSAKLALLWYAENMSPHHVKNMFERLGHLLRVICANRTRRLTEITSADLINYRTTLTDATRWYLGNLSGFLNKWYSLGYPGVSHDATVLLQSLRIQGNKKGEAVLTHDPFYGPFTDIELESIQAAVDRAYADDQIDRETYLLSYLYMLFGQRTIQYASLKVRDVSFECAMDGTPIYMLRIPRAKQRNTLSRAEFKDRIIIPQIGRVLVDHSSEVREVFQGRLADPSDAPLFPSRKRANIEPRGFEYHRTAPALALTSRECFRKLKVMSERTGQPLNITAIRFRRTLATRAAIEGHGELIIAELLDHTDTQNVGVYIEARPEIMDRIDRAIAMHLAPMAQAFAGVIIEDESQATRAGDPSSRICDPRFDATMRPMGNCGKHGFCGFLAPIACYTCVNFQPWLDGPHLAVLDYLIGERDRLASQTDLRIASVNDRTIYAIAEVVRLCEAWRQEKSDG